MGHYGGGKCVLFTHSFKNSQIHLSFSMLLSNSVVFCVAGMSLSLDCKAFFGYSGENRRPIIYWMKGEKFVEELAGHIKESEVR